MSMSLKQLNFGGKCSPHYAKSWKVFLFRISLLASQSQHRPQQPSNARALDLRLRGARGVSELPQPPADSTQQQQQQNASLQQRARGSGAATPGASGDVGDEEHKQQGQALWLHGQEKTADREQTSAAQQVRGESEERGLGGDGGGHGEGEGDGGEEEGVREAGQRRQGGGEHGHRAEPVHQSRQGPHTTATATTACSTSGDTPDTFDTVAAVAGMTIATTTSTVIVCVARATTVLIATCGVIFAGI